MKKHEHLVSNKLAPETQLVYSGNDPSNQYGFVSPPIYRGSTAIYDNVEVMNQAVIDPLKNNFPNYGRFGSPNTQSFEKSLSHLEGGFNAVCTGTGLSAITTAILAFVEKGDHILVVDSVYWPTRNFCNSLKKFGVETQYYDPLIGAQIEYLMRSNTKLVFMESPGSMTFEVQDIPAITQVCKKHNVISMIDNTWATPLFLKPLKLGVDISIHSATKYITGHSDCFLGVIVCNEKTYSKVRTQVIEIGQYASAEDVFLALRGLRTLFVRLQNHQRQALELAKWLLVRPEISEVLHPALEESESFDIWKRDFTGASGLFGFIVKAEYSNESVVQMVESLKLFKLGHSWGGYESLIMISDPSKFRMKESWKKKGYLIRLSVGAENIEDLKLDLTEGFKKFKVI